MSDNRIEYTIHPQGQFSLNLRELWMYRELFFFFTWRDVKVKYKQTILGFLWAILQPLVLMTLFVIFFAKALQVPTDEVPAPIFYYSGLLFWNLFSSGLSGAGNSMISNANIIKKIYFPRLIIPLSSVLVALFDFLMALIIFVVLLLYYEFSDPSFRVDYPMLFIFFPVALLMTVLTTFGVGTFLAALNVKYRDFRYIIPFLIQFLLFATPVIYPASVLKGTSWGEYLLAFNPMTGVMQVGRAAFTATGIEWSTLGISVSAMLFIILLGIYVFRKTEAYFADIA